MNRNEANQKIKSAIVGMRTTLAEVDKSMNPINKAALLRGAAETLVGTMELLQVDLEAIQKQVEIQAKGLALLTPPGQ